MPKAKAGFRKEMAAAGLSQRALGRILAKDATTVNRWCRAAGDNALDVPQYARAFVKAYRLLTAPARHQLEDELGVSRTE